MTGRGSFRTVVGSSGRGATNLHRFERLSSYSS